MPLVMLSRRRIVTSPQAGYWGSHLPTVSSRERRPSASSLRMTAAAKDFDVLPMAKRVSRPIGGSSAARPVRPAKASMAGPGLAKLT